MFRNFEGLHQYASIFCHVYFLLDSVQGVRVLLIEWLVFLYLIFEFSIFRSLIAF
jgi:hypothetical protein